MKTLDLNLDESEVKLILNSLAEMDNKLDHAHATRDDEYETLTFANNRVELHLLQKKIKDQAIIQFGPAFIRAD